MSQPHFIGQVYNSFPGTVANLQVYVEFNGLHPELNGDFDLAVGGGGRGPSPGSHYDVTVTTDASGKFVISPASGRRSPRASSAAQIVVVGQADEPPRPLPGLASSLHRAFRIDKTAPQVTGASSSPGPRCAPRPDPELDERVVADHAHAQRGRPGQPDLLLPGHPAAVISFPAIDPATASNISNYSLIRMVKNSDGTTTHGRVAVHHARRPSSGHATTGRLGRPTSSLTPARSR